MGKPWAKYEVGFIDHPKFLALNGNAISLWLEGKNYCDKHMTDGLIPAHIAKQFRFAGPKTIELLTRSCGPKNESEQYAPLWERHPVGYKMHDYLNHNDCREEVMSRLEDAEDAAEVRKLANRKRQAEYRAKRKSELEALRNAERNTARNAPVTVTCSTPTETVSVTATETSPVATEQQQGRTPARPIPMAPIHDRSHKQHAVCGRVCLHASLFGQFVRRRNTPTADQDIRRWAEGIIDDWTTGAHAVDEPGDEFDFWRRQYDTQWPATVPVAAHSKTPAWAR